MALNVIYCLCGQSSDLSRFMIQCDICKDWFHGRCVGVREYQAVDIDRFHCPRCETYHGPSVLKARLNWHRHDYSEADAANKAVQTGTQVFIKELRGRHFHSCEKVITRLLGDELDLPYIAGEDSATAGGIGEKGGGEEGGGEGGGNTPPRCLKEGGFTQPILVSHKAGLDIVIPHPSFSVVDVENYVGSDHEVDVIDVQRQTDVKMRLHEFIEYFLSPARTTVLNLISLEFCGTGLSQLVEPPSIVRRLCWVNSSWPSDPPPAPPLNRPTVSKYCLIGVENSYTDFHIDFGGTSVWYHVLWGEKIFYLIKPTAANLVLYQRWMKASNHSEMFFGDQVDACYKCEVKAGETLFIPTGWIHAVLTPTDTLVFGGNFLHSYCVDLQLKIYDMEQSMSTPEKFRFPHYQELCWYAGRQLLQELRATAAAPPQLLHGAKALYTTLRQWAHQGCRGAGGGAARVPEGVSAAKLLKELQRELRSTEKQAVALNPPRPERESKRRKKKQLADDFVDYTNLTSFHSALEERLPKKENDDYDSDFHEDKMSLDQQIKQEQQAQHQQQQSLQPQQQHLNLDQKFPPDPSLILQSPQNTQQLSNQTIQHQHIHTNPQQQQHHHDASTTPPTTAQSPSSNTSITHTTTTTIITTSATPTNTSSSTDDKLLLPRAPTTAYSYGLLPQGGGSDYGMSGTPPHDPEYPAYQADYPSNVKTEFDWSESPGVTPYRLTRSVVGSHISTAPHSTLNTVHRTTPNRVHRQPHPTALRMRIGGQSVDSGATNGGPGHLQQQQQQQQRRLFQHRTLQPHMDIDDVGCDDDDDGEGLMIDEGPVNRRRNRQSGVRQHDGRLKLALTTAGGGELVVGGGGGGMDGELVYGSVEVGGEVEVPTNSSSSHHNGIEELLRASAYTPEPSMASQQQHLQQQQYQGYRTLEDIDGSGRASPSTRDAIAGMLSMSRDVDNVTTCVPTIHGGGSVRSGVMRGGAVQHHHRGGRGGSVRGGGVALAGGGGGGQRRYLEEDCIKKVHQDEDYVYPTLDHSDDEDFPIFKPRGKKKEDEAWNPKARVRVWGPRPERPARVGVKKQAVEKGLEVAASRRNALPVAKRAYHRKKARGGGGGGGGGGVVVSGSGGGGNVQPQLNNLVSGGGGGLCGGPSSTNITSNLNITSHHHQPTAAASHPSTNTINNNNNTTTTTTTHHHHRPKKGMATAKQRLGKILKIHKMIY